jgi:hypothetical protein
MFHFGGRKNCESESVRIALDKSQARIEFRPDVTILGANRNFLDALGYELNEVSAGSGGCLHRGYPKTASPR